MKKLKQIIEWFVYGLAALLFLLLVALYFVPELSGYLNQLGVDKTHLNRGLYEHL
jgi:hypothetical protein